MQPILITNVSFATDAYVLDYHPMLGKREGHAVIGEIQCLGTELELVECSHASIGKHHCGGMNENNDIIISCYGVMFINYFIAIPSSCYSYHDFNTIQILCK